MSTARHIAKIVFGWAPEEELHETAWLNGARGLAAFNVMMAHFSMAWMSTFADAPFGAAVLSDRNPDGVWYFRKDDRLWAPWRLPIARVFFCAGGPQVAVFFVISGFVLTWGPLGSVQAGRDEKLYKSLGSSTIRRWFRLYVPCIIVCIAFLIHGIAKQWEGIVPMLQQIWDYFVRAEKWANPFQSVKDTELSEFYIYNIVIWTIPFEFSGSIFVYVLLLCLGRVRSFPRRVSVILLITLYALFSLNWGLWLFGSGMALADYSRHSGGFRKPSQEPTSRWKSVLWSSCLVFSLLLLSFMPESDWFSRPGYDLTTIIPLPIGWRASVGEERFWWGCGGILLIASSCHLKLMRSFFELPLLQHLGKISFMLYLIHFLVNHTIAMTLWRALYDAICKKEFDDTFNDEVYRTSPIINIGVFCILWIVCVPAAMIAGHVLETFVDRPVTAFAKWLDEKLVDGIGTTRNKVIPLDEEEEQLLESRNADDLEMDEVPPPPRP